MAVSIYAEGSIRRTPAVVVGHRGTVVKVELMIGAGRLLAWNVCWGMGQAIQISAGETSSSATARAEHRLREGLGTA